MQIVSSVFDTRNDPIQLQVDEKVLDTLGKLHPATFSEYNEGNGPCIWTLMIPTTEETMNLFVTGKISEQELYKRTKPGQIYEALYLCSVITLPEYRKKGLTIKLCLEAIEKIRKDFPIKALYVWSFTKQGEALAEKISETLNLPLLKRIAEKNSKT